MRCYACDCMLDENTSPDRPTGRMYCTECFSFTTETVLALEGKERYLEENVISLDELNDNEDQEEPDDVPWED